MERERIEEALELLWVMEEDGHSDIKRFHLNLDDPDSESLLKILAEDGLAITDDKTVRLSDKGKGIARGLVRKHRLAERLFTDVFELSMDIVEEDACRMEHVLSDELTDSVCTFLGHPPTCPHGKPIPRGECCKKYIIDVRPVVMRLTDFEVGKKGRISFIAASDAAKMSRLSSIGVIPGSVIKLIQKKPSIVLQIDETTVALDAELAADIFVKRLPESF
ncbi:MAG: metal-dependent transcriptional regulator [Nitrospirae bacterium]|nr:metal-dependent transcriptional regulator [Nitrospirota bacterium]